MRKGFKGSWAWRVCGLFVWVAGTSALAASPTGVDKPVAVVLGREISRADLSPSESERQAMRAKLSPENYARWESISEVQALQDFLLRPLLLAYVQRKGLVPAKQDIEALSASISALTNDDRAKAKGERERLRVELQRVDLSPEKRQALQTSLESVEKDLQLRAEEMAYEEDAMRDVAEGAVLSWMVQRALHREFGGDIIFQQAGPEAVGAYPRFLEQRQKAGDFKIHDEELGRRFWARVREAPGYRMEQDALETPWWLAKPKR
ncbi:hypothetical protein [Myxococcus stipitatus]|uniref:hypothetical protein n=1 Tax=Myxococcus stipitatus TaxID=83455 RepID=UPI0030D50B48